MRKFLTSTMTVLALVGFATTATAMCLDNGTGMEKTTKTTKPTTVAITEGATPMPKTGG